MFAIFTFWRVLFNYIRTAVDLFRRLAEFGVATPRACVCAHQSLSLSVCVVCLCTFVPFFFVSLCRYIVYHAHFLMLAIMMVMMVVRQKYEVRYTVGRVYCNLVHTAKSESQLCAFWLWLRLRFDTVKCNNHRSISQIAAFMYKPC